MNIKMFDIPASSPKHYNRYLHLCLTVLFSHLCENRKRFLISSDVVAGIAELWEAELLDSLILINVVPGISMVMGSLGHF